VHPHARGGYYGAQEESRETHGNPLTTPPDNPRINSRDERLQRALYADGARFPGGALGRAPTRAGVYQALAEARCAPDPIGSPASRSVQSTRGDYRGEGPGCAAASSAPVLEAVDIILALVFWFWMWGVPGAILAVPMRAIVKIVGRQGTTQVTLLPGRGQAAAGDPSAASPALPARSG
jgi:hypothetical protein